MTNVIVTITIIIMGIEGRITCGLAPARLTPNYALGVIETMRVGVRNLKLKAVTQAFLDADLHGVVPRLTGSRADLHGLKVTVDSWVRVAGRARGYPTSRRNNTTPILLPVDD